MDVGATAQWRKVTAFDPASGVALDALLAADFPPIIIRNGIILVPIAVLSNVATLTPWVEGGVYNAGGGRYYIGFPDASWATKATTEIWGKSDTAEIVANPVEVGASLTAQETADASKLIPTGEMSSLFTGVTVAAIAAGIAASSAGPRGPSSVTVTFQDSATPTPNRVPLVDFTIQGQGPGRADTNGLAAFGLEDGTYTLIAGQTAGILFNNSTLIVSGTTTLTVTGTAIAITPAPGPGQCTIAFTAIGADGANKNGAIFYVRVISGPDGQTVNGLPQIITSSGTANNNTQFNAPRLCTCGIKRGNNGEEVTFVVPNSPTALLADLLDRAIVGEDKESP